MKCMKKMYYIGVDGGGTKTALAAFDENGKQVAESLSGPLNYNFIGLDAAFGNLRDGIAALGLPEGSIAAIGIGDPSIDDIPDSPNALAFLEKCEKELGVPVFIRSDAYMTLFALTEGKERGVLVISGTGAIALGEDEKGKVLVAGGWGRLSDDEGSGYYIGISGLRAALRSADRIAPDTALLPAALEYFGKNEPRELIEAFYGETEPDIAGFSRKVAECADSGDYRANEILLSAAKFLADYAGVLIEECDAKLVGTYGSVLCKNKKVREEFERILRERFDDVTIKEPSVSAQCAAAMYAKMNFEKGMY